jgi:hypothetical protein
MDQKEGQEMGGEERKVRKNSNTALKLSFVKS